LPGTGFAVGYWDWVEAVREGVGDDFDFSVMTAGEERGLELGFVVVVRCCVGVGVTLLPGVVTLSEEAVVVVVL
jgi:hypothetical protein